MSVKSMIICVNTNYHINIDNGYDKTNSHT
jgi:hypothetical protein